MKALALVMVLVCGCATARPPVVDVPETIAVEALQAEPEAEPLPRTGEPCTLAHPLDAGDVAPCSGELLPSLKVKALLLIRKDRQRLADALEAEKERHAADLERDAKEIASLTKAWTAAEAKALEPVVVHEEPSWWASPWLWGAVGLAVGVAAGVVTRR